MIVVKAVWKGVVIVVKAVWKGVVSVANPVGKGLVSVFNAFGKGTLEISQKKVCYSTKGIIKVCFDFNSGKEDEGAVQSKEGFFNRRSSRSIHRLK